MQPPMFGSWPVVVRAARPFAIHGDIYYEVHIERTDEPPSGGAIVKIPSHAVTTEPRVGDRLTMTFLMGQVTAVTNTAE